MRRLIFFVIAYLLIGGVSLILPAEPKGYTPAPFDSGKLPGASGIFDSIVVITGTDTVRIYVDAEAGRFESNNPVICGGYQDSVFAIWQFIGGGYLNRCGPNGQFAAIVGGREGICDGYYSAILGGCGNTIASGVFSSYNAICGGYRCSIDTGNYNFIGGGHTVKIRGESTDGACAAFGVGSIVDSCLGSFAMNCHIKKADSTFGFSKQIWVIDGADTNKIEGEWAILNKLYVKDSTFLNAVIDSGNHVVIGTITGKIKEIIKASTGNITVAECKSTLINNYGQGSANTQTLPTAAQGLNCQFVLITIGNAFHIDVQAGDKFFLDGVALDDADKISCAVPAVGDAISIMAVQTGASSYDWIARTIQGTWIDGG